MRTYRLRAATVVAAILLAACSDGSEGLGSPALLRGPASSPSSSSGNGASTVDSAGSVAPAGGNDGSGSGASPTAVENGTRATSPIPGMDGASSPLPIAGTDPMGGPSTTTSGAGDAPATGNPASSGSPAMGGGLKRGPFKILVLSTTLEFHHDSIPACNQLLNDLGQGSAPERAKISGLAPDVTWTVDQMGADPAAPDYFSEISAESLASYDVVFSNNPTGPVFTNAPDGANKKTTFQTWFENGGGWAGQHSATDFENNSRWTWWDDHVAGGWFTDHDNDGTPGTVSWQTQFADHPILKGLPSPWNTSDEWYIMNRNIEAVPGFNVLAKVTVSNSTKPNGAQPRPAIWTTENAKGGRAFYTIRGHSQSVYAEDEFRQLLLRGILWAAHRLPGGN